MPRNEISLVIIIPTLRVYICRAHKKRHKSRGWQTKRLSPCYWKTIVRDAIRPSSTSVISFEYFIRAVANTYISRVEERKGGEFPFALSLSLSPWFSRFERGLWIFGEDRWRWRTTCLSSLRFLNCRSLPLMRECNVFARSVYDDKIVDMKWWNGMIETRERERGRVIDVAKNNRPRGKL